MGPRYVLQLLLSEKKHKTPHRKRKICTDLESLIFFLMNARQLKNNKLLLIKISIDNQAIYWLKDPH
jgi:hypothetical protein